MDRIELIKALETQENGRVLLRGHFGDTFMDIAGVQGLNDGKILIQSAADPIMNEELSEYTGTFGMAVEIKEFIGTEPEVFQNVGIGFEEREEGEIIYVETEEDDGTIGAIALDAEQARWLSEKLVEYAKVIEEADGKNK